MSTSNSIVPLERIESSIVMIRGHKVMLDSDLAVLYQVKVKALNQAVIRNASRFPDDFMFQLTRAEYESLRSQFGTLKKGRGMHRKYAPYAFTELGVAMLSSVLRSERAIQTNIEIMRAFVELRRLAYLRANWSRRLDEVEGKLNKRLDGHDKRLTLVFDAIRKLIAEDEHTPTLGFARDQDDAKKKRG